VFKPGTPEKVVIEHLTDFEAKVWELNDELLDELDKGDIFKFSFSGTGSTMNGSDQGAHAGGIQIFYEDLDDKGISANELIKRLKKKIGNVPEAEKFTIGGQQRFGNAIYVRILGTDIAQLEEAKGYLKTELKKLTELKEVQDNVDIGKREMQFDLSPQAYFMGLSHDRITKQVRQGFFGEEVQRLQKGTDEVRVWVRYPGSGRISIGQLEDMKIKTTKGEEFPLTELVSYDFNRSIAGIRHYSGTRVISVFADMVDPDAEVPPVMKKVEEEIVPQMLQNYPGVSVDYGGQSKESAKAQSQIGLYFGGAFVVIFFILMITFKSFYQAILVMAMIPLGWVGSAIGHGIEGHPVSLLSAWGMIALSGVIINDAVVFLSKYNTFLKEGLSAYEAAYKAGTARFRAIVLTSITTVLGLYPLIMETSFQAQFLIPMAISVAYGVLIGTVFILLFFPVLILIFNDVRRVAKWFWTGTKPTAEDVERVLIDEKRVDEYRKIA
jgi:multidrug efflux pump subunit AcrB